MSKVCFEKIQNCSEKKKHLFINKLTVKAESGRGITMTLIQKITYTLH